MDTIKKLWWIIPSIVALGGAVLKLYIDFHDLKQDNVLIKEKIKKNSRLLGEDLERFHEQDLINQDFKNRLDNSDFRHYTHVKELKK